jgi:hypothetical protein
MNKERREERSKDLDGNYGETSNCKKKKWWGQGFGKEKEETNVEETHEQKKENLSWVIWMC